MLLIPVEVRQSPIQGLGVFAAAPIKAGTKVWQLDPGIDQLLPVEWAQEQPAHVREYVETHCVLTLDRQHYLSAGDQTRFINHSSLPNLVPLDEVQVNGEGIVVAARDIAAGEELTVDYGSIDAGDRDRIEAGLPLFETPTPVRPAGNGRGAMRSRRA